MNIPTTQNLYIIDSGVSGYGTLIEALPEGSKWAILSSEQDDLVYRFTENSCQSLPISINPDPIPRIFWNVLPWQRCTSQEYRRRKFS